MFFATKLKRFFAFKGGGVIVVFVCSSLISQAFAPWAIATSDKEAFDLPHYSFRVSVHPEAHSLNVHQTIRMTNTSPRSLTEAVFDFFPARLYNSKEQWIILKLGEYFNVNAFPSGFPEQTVLLESVKVQGKEASALWTDESHSGLRVSLKEPWAPGEVCEFELTYQVRLPHAYGRFGWMDQVMKLARWYAMPAYLDEQGWHPVKMYPFHRPFHNPAGWYDVTVDVPQGYQVIHPGQQQRISTQNGLTTWVLSSQKPMREWAMVIADHVATTHRTQDGVTVEIVHPPEAVAWAQRMMDTAFSALSFYAQQFQAPYPYDRFVIAAVPLGYGGEQFAGLIFLDDRLFSAPRELGRYVDFLVAHEIGHQWLYNLIGVDAYHEIWLEEGSVSFLVQKYLVQRFGPQASVIEWPVWLEPVVPWLPSLTFEQTKDIATRSLIAQGYDTTILKELYGFREPTFIFATAYGKGARVFEMLEQLMGEEALRRVWRRLAQEKAFDIVSVAEFKDLCEQESGQDLDSFFKAWLTTNGVLDYAVESRRQGLFLVDHGDLTMPVPVRVMRQDGSVSWIRYNGGEPQYLAQKASGIVSVSIDPLGKWFDIDRVNNHWPRQVKTTTNPIYWPVYDHPLFQDADARNFFIAPEIHRGVGLKVSWHEPFRYGLYAGTDYELGEHQHHSRVGGLWRFFGTPWSAGFEISNTNDLSDDENDIASGKLHLRRNLWPEIGGPYSRNDHVSLYLLRRMSLRDSTDLDAGVEDASQIDYDRDSALAGVALWLDRSVPDPSPHRGWILSVAAEQAGHFLGATTAFHRAFVGGRFYLGRGPSVWAQRIKMMVGGPSDKGLFVLGGSHGLRGYGRKQIRTPQGLLWQGEWRRSFALKKRSLLWGWLRFKGIETVLFADAARVWTAGFTRHEDWFVDMGGGLRFSFDAAGGLENILLRIDVAHPIDDPDGKTRVWWGLEHAF